jgi:DeoR family transcriptional regulator of aga operon/DeoR family fructose operon transcriptional repressor
MFLMTKPAPGVLMTDKSKPDSRLLPSERLLQIRQLVNAKGVVRVSELAARFEVSDMTIRRDLSELEKLGAIEKTFGAAVSSEQASFESSVSERMHLRQAHKRAIAKAAAQHVDPGDTVAIDASTTGLALAQELRMHNVHVVTSGLDVTQALRGGAATVITTGGTLRERSGGFVGPLALRSLEHIRVDKAFFSAKGVLVPDGFVDSDLGEVDVKRMLLSTAARIFALLDSSKFGKRAMGVIGGFDLGERLISDDELAEDALAALAPHVQVELAHLEVTV